MVDKNTTKKYENNFPDTLPGMKQQRPKSMYFE